MKLFFREQMPLLLIYFLQLFLILLVYWLDGYRNMAVSVYAAVLSICLLTGYLIYRYIRNKGFYQQLEKPLASIEDLANESQGAGSPLTEGLQQLLKNQYSQYKKDLQKYKYRLEDHIQFINQWVHQMKTPISVIHLMIQEEDDQRFNAIGDEVDRLKKGLELVLYSARLETFERDFYVETLRLESIVRSVTSSQKRLFIRKRIFPSIQIDVHSTIVSDEKWLSFVFTQLITNAIRYTVEENKKVFFRGYNRGKNSILEIQDEGVGIPSSDIPRVFDPYFTGENGRNFQESTGMGLYLAKQICEKLGHKIEIESKVTHGTTVRIIF
ncbi:sensor histidine kinase [Cytobacillus massiliigabonensis]|uniref:sensor histidine kinase n=1 Tax=Cytobacillus massiliigabonensis TaxID=1871011 RepID=UPI000C8261B4|nr:sensor histidine kinase [Cytobacillus massiliigabonensis]